MIGAPNLDHRLELDVTIVCENWLEHLGFTPSFYTHASSGTSRPLSSALNKSGYVCSSYDWTYSFDKLKRVLLLFW